MLEEAAVVCPYCSESVSVLVDLSAGDQRYVEDCPVCCQPMVVAVRLDETGELVTVDAAREND